MDQEHPHKPREIPVRRITFWIGIACTLLGYGFLSAPPETLAITASARAFTGLGLVIGGAFLWLGAIFFG